jgi:orotate phosphoribosyltransferase
VDREQGGAKDLADHGYRLHSVLGLREILTILTRYERISAEQEKEVLAFLAGGDHDG